LVDDDPDIREAISDALAAEGDEVVLAHHGGMALEELERLGQPCLILLDMMMPVMDGPEFLQRFRLHPTFTEVPVIVCTASGLTEPPAGAQALLQKPFELNELMARIAASCTARRVAPMDARLRGPTAHPAPARRI
jgi:CheY-like chemotaxis protein